MSASTRWGRSLRIGSGPMSSSTFRVLFTLTLATLASATWLSAQAARPRFDVTSVKRSPPEASQGFGRAIRTAGVLDFSNTSVWGLIEFAYDIDLMQVVGDPDWIHTEGYAVTAKAESNTSTDQMRLMTQSMLEDRFKLVARKEHRPSPHLDLVPARVDGALGPNAQLVGPGEDCAAA